MSTVINNSHVKSVYESITNKQKAYRCERRVKIEGRRKVKIYYKINDGSMDVKITKTSR
jgi:hypothetical protein